ncbi:hypothetical protein OSTOST_21273, partial [Ostertagia ostertagi]
SNPHPITDYRSNIAGERKRVLPAPQLPAHSDANFLEPDMKCPKIEKDVSLADLNSDTISRPNHINFDMIGLGNTNIPLSTPTNITYTTGTTPYTTAGTYSAGFPGWFQPTTRCNCLRRSSEVPCHCRLNNDFERQHRVDAMHPAESDFCKHTNATSDVRIRPSGFVNAAITSTLRPFAIFHRN